MLVMNVPMKNQPKIRPILCVSDSRLHGYDRAGADYADTKCTETS